MSVGDYIIDSEEEDDEMMIHFDDEMDLLLLHAASNRSTNAHPINKKRIEFGEYHHLYPDLRKDPGRFFEYMRMSPSTFDYVCDTLRPHITKNWCNFHTRPIVTEERVMLTVR